MPRFDTHITGTPVDPAAGTAGVRTLGTGASQAAAGNHTHSYQASDQDLTDIAGLSPSNDDIMQRKSGAWTNRTLAQVKTDLALNNVDNTSNATERAAARTLTNARITKRVGTATNNASLTIDSDSYDQYNLTAMSAATTMNNPSGSPTSGQLLLMRFKDNGTARAFTWSGSQWRAIGVTLPTTTVANKTLYVGAAWSSDDSKWDVIAVSQEA